MDDLNLDQFTACVMHSDMEKTGDFHCSNQKVNQLQSNIAWGQRGNFLDIPTDCPQRDERLGWTGDAQIFSWAASFNPEYRVVLPEMDAGRGGRIFVRKGRAACCAGYTGTVQFFRMERRGGHRTVGRVSDVRRQRYLGRKLEMYA